MNMCNRICLLSIIISIAFFFSEVEAGHFTIRIVDYGTNLGPLRTEVDSLFQALENTINQDLPDVDVSTYLQGVGAATSYALHGTSVDYTGSVEHGIFGLGMGAAVDAGATKFSHVRAGSISGNSIRGVGLGPHLMGGASLGFINRSTTKGVDPKRVRVYINLISKSFDGFLGPLAIASTNLGFHLQYVAFPSEKNFPSLFFRWKGIDLTSGMMFNKLNILYEKSISKTSSQTVSGSTVEASYTGVAAIQTESAIITIPLEVSSAVQILYLLTYFGGFAIDLNYGYAKSGASVYGDVFAITSALPGFTGNARAQAGLNIEQKEKIKFSNSRLFSGVQFNLWNLKLVAQINRGLYDNVLGAYIGTRIAW